MTCSKCICSNTYIIANIKPTCVSICIIWQTLLRLSSLYPPSLSTRRVVAKRLFTVRRLLFIIAKPTRCNRCPLIKFGQLANWQNHAHDRSIIARRPVKTRCARARAREILHTDCGVTRVWVRSFPFFLTHTFSVAMVHPHLMTTAFRAWDVAREVARANPFVQSNPT